MPVEDAGGTNVEHKLALIRPCLCPMGDEEDKNRIIMAIFQVQIQKSNSLILLL